MLAFTLRRLSSTLLVLWGVVTVTFFATRLLPGDPATVLVSQGGGSAEDIADLREQLGLNDPLPIQYLRFLNGLVRGNLGESLVSHRPVVDAIGEQLPHTLALATTATILSIVVGIPWVSWRRHIEERGSINWPSPFPSWASPFPYSSPVYCLSCSSAWFWAGFPRRDRGRGGIWSCQR